VSDSLYTFGASASPDENGYVEAVGLGDEETMLSKLRSSLSKKVEKSSVLLEVPERPELVIRYSPNITNQQMKAWRRASGADRKEGMDTVRFACHVLTNTCNGMLLDGVEITDGGSPVTFSHDVVMKMVGASRVFDCVQAVYGIEPHVETAALAVLDAAGFNDEVEKVDPTKIS
jgi:hypothetical protein